MVGFETFLLAKKNLIRSRRSAAIEPFHDSFTEDAVHKYAEIGRLYQRTAVFIRSHAENRR